MLKTFFSFVGLLFLMNPVLGQDFSTWQTAIKNNDYAVVDSLIAVGVDVNVTDENGATPLMWAVYWTDLEMVKKFGELQDTCKK